MSKNTHARQHLYFLDNKGAYDNVNRTLLWDQLLSLGATPAMVNVIKKLYKDTIYNIHWEGFQSGDLEAS